MRRTTDAELVTTSRAHLASPTDSFASTISRNNSGSAGEPSVRFLCLSESLEASACKCKSGQQHQTSACHVTKFVCIITSSIGSCKSAEHPDNPYDASKSPHCSDCFSIIQAISHSGHDKCTAGLAAIARKLSTTGRSMGGFFTNLSGPISLDGLPQATGHPAAPPSPTNAGMRKEVSFGDLREAAMLASANTASDVPPLLPARWTTAASSAE